MLGVKDVKTGVFMVVFWNGKEFGNFFRYCEMFVTM